MYPWMSWVAVGPDIVGGHWAGRDLAAEVEVLCGQDVCRLAARVDGVKTLLKRIAEREPAAQATPGVSGPRDRQCGAAAEDLIETH